MATGRKSKNAKRLQNMHEYFHTKVEQVEKERNYDRSWATKQHLVNLKKEKLAAKDQIQNGKKI
tara:strand:- start:2227 stop:2418 length:192 start_codon:yes stop_codon:yes gene_type:complete